jgi:nucleotide-binding universal stress UspA family protein
MLKLASRVKVVELAEADALNPARRHVADVVAWLERHGIAADCAVQLSDGDDANALRAIGDDQGADVIVAGAYGHSRLREWVLGGVTRDLLLSSTRCALLSH